MGFYSMGVFEVEDGREGQFSSSSDVPDDFSIVGRLSLDWFYLSVLLIDLFAFALTLIPIGRGDLAGFVRFRNAAWK